MRKTSKIDESFDAERSKEENKRIRKEKVKEVLHSDLLNTPQRPRPKWTVKDKTMLLEALKTYGHGNMEKVNAMLPDKSPAAIRTKISKIIKESRNRRRAMKYETTKVSPKVQYMETDESCIGKWLKTRLFDKKDYNTSRILHYISLFEDHPPISILNKCDYRSIYYFLYCLSLGQVPPELTPETKTVFYSILSEILKENVRDYEEEVFDYLSKLSMKYSIKREYPGQSKVSEDYARIARQ